MTKLSLPAWYGDKMVLQQQVRTRIYGHTSPSAEVRLSLERFPSGRLLASTQEAEYGLIFQESDYAEADGFFEFRLPMIEASYDSFRLSIEAGGEKRVFRNIYFGEVWMAAGGSNMAMPVAYTDVVAKAKQISPDSGLRFFTQNEFGLASANKQYSYQPKGRIYGGHWIDATELDKIQGLSALAVAFAIDIQAELNVPVAVFSLACPISMIHSWLPRSVIEEDALISNHIREIHHYRDQDNWNELPAEDRSEERFLNRTASNRDQAAEDVTFHLHNQPAALFNHKLAPYTSLGIRGFLWYQGEEDVQYPDYYRRALRYLTAVLKEMFQSPLSGIYFIYSQITPRLSSVQDPSRLACFNEALTAVRRQLALRAGIVTNYDLPLSFQAGKGLYNSPDTPRAKLELARRMALVALGLAYKQDNMPTSAPECQGAELVGNKLLLNFENAGQGIRLKSGETQVKGFSICNQDRHYVLAEAKELYQLRVIVWHDEISNPTSCAYAFWNFNQEANLVSSQGIPLLPFRLDREQASWEKPRQWADCDALEGFRFPITDPRSPRMGGKATPGIYPLWTFTNGRGHFSLEKDNKRQGAASILISYSKADERPLRFGPVLDYASDYPPLDLRLWEELHCVVFNTEHRVKTLSLALSDANGRETVSAAQEIRDILSWQKISFKLKDAPVDLMRLTKLEFVLQDPDAEGLIYMDQIEFTGYTPF